MPGRRIGYFLLLTLLSLPLFSCEQPPPPGAAKLEQAIGARQQGNFLEAERLFREVAESARQTPEGKRAMEGLKEIASQRMQVDRDLRSVMESLVQVFEGYRSMYGHYPASLTELDQSGYFFDTKYLQDLASDSVRVYLLLGGDKPGCGIWAYNDTFHNGLVSSGEGFRYRPFQGKGTIENLLNVYREESRQNNLIAMSVRQGA